MQAKPNAVLLGLSKMTEDGWANHERWIECSNGHPLIIPERIRAVQASSCPECHALIGDTSHRLSANNRATTLLQASQVSGYTKRIRRVYSIEPTQQLTPFLGPGVLGACLQVSS